MNQIFTVGNDYSQPLVLELVKGLPTALVALVIGLIAAGIALRQYRVAAGKFNLDLFHERYKVYEVIFAYLKDCHYKHRLDRGPEQPFLDAMPKAHFLFGPEVADFMKEIIAHREKQDDASEDIEAYRPVNPEWNLAQTKNAISAQFFDDSLRSLPTRFGKYMDFRGWVGTGYK